MKFEITNNDPELFGGRQVRITIETFQDAATEILVAAEKIHDEHREKKRKELFDKLSIKP